MKISAMVRSTRCLQLSCLLLLVFTTSLVIHSYSQYVVSHPSLVRLVKTREYRLLAMTREGNIVAFDPEAPRTRPRYHVLDNNTIPVVTKNENRGADRNANTTGIEEEEKNKKNCSASKSLFVAWQRGIVTQMGPPLNRNCAALRRDPAKEIKKSKLISQLKKWKSERPWESLALRYKNMNCEEMKNEFDNNFYVSQVEKDFPIAYIFVVYTNAGQVLRLLKSIYRPHNLYCIHPDARQGKEFKLFFERVAKCLDNVFVVSKPVRVYYGHISITEAQLHCMKDLEKYPDNRWRYVINLCGREIPIKTNREIVQSLIKLKGYSSVSTYPLPKSYKGKRFWHKFQLDKNGTNRITEEKQARPPGGINLFKGMNFVAASRNFVRFLLHDRMSIKFFEFLHTVYAPEEHFYSSLYNLQRAKGAKPPSELLTTDDLPIIDGFIWLSTTFQKHHVTQFCPGANVVHCICILSAADLAEVEKLAVASRQPVFFFNKYFLEWDPTPMDCMEERLIQANMDEYRKDCLLSSQH